MRKVWFAALLAALMLICAPALAETYVFDDLRATVEVPDSYVVLKPDNLSNYATWLESRGTSAEALAADMEARGVLLQCWSEAYDLCFELTAVQNDRATNYWDVNEQSESIRRSYRLSHYPDNEYEGYDFSSADWKNTENGRFLIMKYAKRENGDTVWHGFMRRTIRNGYELTFDMQVHGRAATNKDNTALNKIWESFKFVELTAMPPAASAKLNITTIPPLETNDPVFNIEGTAAEGVKLTAVVMGLNYPTPVLFEAEVGKSGKFKMPIQLPKEGVFLITVTGEYQGTDVIELAYPVTYQRTLLSVITTVQPGDTVTTDKTVIQGTGTPGALIQIFVNGESAGTKKVTAAGRFKLELDTAKEGEYDVTLAFSKKGLADRRFTYHFLRQWSDEDMIKQLDSGSISPGYSTLVKKIDGYDGRTMRYTCYVVDVTQSGAEWIVKLALTKRGDEYRSVMLVTTGEEPALTVGGKIKMYGTCAGMSIPSEEGGESYPCFELLKFVSAS